MKKLLFTLLGSALLLVGCAPSSIVVPEVVENKVNYDVVKIVQKDGVDAVTQDVLVKFKTAFESRMLKDFSNGEGGLVVEYRFIAFDEGNRAMRYLVGFGAGKGKMTVEATFYDSAGNKLAVAEASGEIVMGLFGGSFDEAVDSAASELHKFAIRNFKI